MGSIVEVAEVFLPVAILKSIHFFLQITCPGTRHLNDRNMLYLSVCILGQTKRTKSVFASFPLALNERLYFERVSTVYIERLKLSAVFVVFLHE